MRLSFYPYQLHFKFPFHISHGVRLHTEVVYVKLEHENFVAWGEAALPPYLPETQKSVIEFLTGFSKSCTSKAVDDWFGQLEKVTVNLSAKAALDMSLWDLKSQMENKTIGELLGIEPANFPMDTYTIGVCSYDEMKLKVEEAEKFGFKIFKLKLDGRDDDLMISNFQKLSDKKFAVDVNQGWKNAEEAFHKAGWLKDCGCFLIEQPLNKNAITEMNLTKRDAILPIYADESCQRLSDIDKIKSAFDGINIKLMKCGGIREAYRMIRKAREYGLKVLIGCMSESSVGCTAGAHLTPLADYADLDGPYLIANDPFEGMKVKEGRIQINPLVQKISF